MNAFFPRVQRRHGQVRRLRWLSQLCLLTLSGAASIAFAAGPAPTDPEVSVRLAELDAEYRASLDRDVTQAHLTAIQDLDAKYAAALNQAFSVATSGGKLEDAVALQAEKERLKASQPLPESDDATVPPVLARLRSTYRTAAARLDAERDRKSQPSLQRYRTVLNSYQAELTQKGKLEDAVAISNKIKSLGGGVPSSPATPGRPGKVKIENMELVPLKLGASLFADRDRDQWTTIPESFAGARFAQAKNEFEKVAKIKVTNAGMIYLACTSRWSGGYSEPAQVDFTTEAELKADGWKKEAKVLKAEKQDYSWIIFSRQCKSGETFNYRTDMYNAPIVIVPDA